MLGIESKKADTVVRPGRFECVRREGSATLMGPKTNDAMAPSPRVIPEKADRMARMPLRKTESEDSLAEIGECLDAARNALGWTINELAGRLPPPPGKVNRDPAQVQRWLEGKERTQVDVVFRVPELQQPFVVEMAKLAKCEIETTVRIRAKRMA